MGKTKVRKGGRYISKKHIVPEVQEGKQSNKHNKKKKNPMVLDLMQLTLKICLIVGCVFAVFTFVYGIIRVPDISMEPAVHEGDLALYYRLDKIFRVGEVAVVQYQGKKSIGRVVAMEGDTVDITADGLMINGALQVSQDISCPTTQYAQGVSFPLTVGSGQVFMLGDNRPGATDSRVYGCVDLDDIQGKVITVIRTRGI